MFQNSLFLSRIFKKDFKVFYKNLLELSSNSCQDGLLPKSCFLLTGALLFDEPLISQSPAQAVSGLPNLFGRPQTVLQTLSGWHIF
jgi:hypothetical protein